MSKQNQEQRGCAKCFEVEWHIRGCGNYPPTNVYPVLDSERSPDDEDFSLLQPDEFRKHVKVVTDNPIVRERSPERHPVAHKWQPTSDHGSAKCQICPQHRDHAIHEVAPQPPPETEKEHVEVLSSYCICGRLTDAEGCPPCGQMPSKCPCVPVDDDELLPCPATNRLADALEYAGFQNIVADGPRVTFYFHDQQYKVDGIEAHAVAETCKWTDEVDYWRSSCGEEWCFVDGGPKENRVQFCHGCGKRVEEETIKP